jgi:hypothetical protein
MVVAPLLFGCRSIAGDDSLRQCAPANPRLDATDDAKDQEGALEVRKVTLNSKACSAGLGVVGDGGSDMNSGDPLRARTA